MHPGKHSGYTGPHRLRRLPTQASLDTVSAHFEVLTEIPPEKNKPCAWPRRVGLLRHLYANHVARKVGAQKVAWTNHHFAKPLLRFFWDKQTYRPLGHFAPSGEFTPLNAMATAKCSGHRPEAHALNPGACTASDTPLAVHSASKSRTCLKGAAGGLLRARAT